MITKKIVEIKNVIWIAFELFLFHFAAKIYFLKLCHFRREYTQRWKI